MIVSFAWTTPALVTGNKTVTRRDWSPAHAAKFRAGQLIDAWNWSPRVVQRSPHKVATIRLWSDVYLQGSNDVYMLADDVKAEGFSWMRANGYESKVKEVVDDWMNRPRDLYVVRFELVEVVEPCWFCGKGREEAHWPMGYGWLHSTAHHTYLPKLVGDAQREAAPA